MDWEIHFIDGSHRAGSQARFRGKKSTLEKEALGRSPGGLTTKIHVRVDGKGQIIMVLLTLGQTHEISVAEKLMEQGANVGESLAIKAILRQQFAPICDGEPFE